MDHASTIDSQIGERVKALRDAGGLTLAALAARSGVSKAMLSRIERGESSATAQLLSRLCGGLGIAMAGLFATTGDDAGRLRRRADQPVWRDPVTRYGRRSVGPSGAAADLVEIDFPPGARVALDSLRLPGVEQMVWMLEGTMEIGDGDGEVRLERGDCLRMRLDTPTTFHNPGRTPARYAVIVTRRSRA